MIVGYTFSGLSYPSPAFARFIEAMLDGREGIIKGGDVQLGNNEILVGEGDFVIKGRHFKVIGSETIDLELPASGILFGLLVAEIDLTKESSSSNFEQVEFKILTSAQNYPNVTQQDINSGSSSDNLYQYAMGQFKLNSNGIYDYKDKRTFLDFDSIYDEIQRHIDEIEAGQLGENYVTGEEYATNDRLDGRVIYFRRYQWSKLFDKGRAGKPLGIPLSDIEIFKIEGYAYSNTGNVFTLSTGDLNNSSDSTIKLGIHKDSNTIIIDTVNANFMNGKAYANLYYTKKSDSSNV